MNCEKVLDLIEDYHYGELSAEVASEVASHLHSCRSCTRELEALVAEDELFHSYSESLDRNIDVKSRLWHSVRGRLASEHARGSGLPWFFAWLPDSRLARYAVFASVVACISVGATLLTVRMFAPAPQEHVSNVDHSSPPNSLEAALQSVQRAETEYLEAIRILSAIVDKQKETLDPGQRAKLDRNLKVLDQGIAKARQAYRAHPSDPELGFYMLAAYREKVELLEEHTTS
jgi:anti-sigma factor RsiW